MTNNDRLRKLGNAVRALTGIGFNPEWGWVKRLPQRNAKIARRVNHWEFICAAHNIDISGITSRYSP